ncbi:PSD1 and planctomycete cytochrome C domain-containing protein [Planctomicrobium sp. SH661]|uniref:PSD1 and planctomycete cytochrome C domain-containing protein n=1 Tax=Planctomicrobium sp. SH661 TaxID=3448124 RepID=UPI003F5C89EE
MPNRRFVLVALWAVMACSVQPSSAFADEREQFFETHIRPLLAKRCFECHGDKKQESSVRLDHKSMVMGNTTETALIQPGKVDESRLWQVVKYDDSDIQMPPEAPLPEDEKEMLKLWIEQGAYWPEETSPAPAARGGIPRNSDGSINFVEAVAQHWAYRPIENVPVPAGADGMSSIDRFLSASLSEAGLSFSEPAPRETLIRRLKMDLHGVPPTFDEVQAFVQDTRPDALERLVDELLASPLYGQRWGRHWLDLARYADTKGYVFTENRFYPFSYTYRDYVVNALNEDKPYNEFVKEQLAADHLGLPEGDPRLAALGFLTVGPRFLNREPDIIDDRIDVVTRGLMGMTVACARCHDHKYDPIPTKDYYSLYGVFQSSYEPEQGPLLGKVDENAPQLRSFYEERKKREQAIADYITQSHAELLQQSVDKLEDLIPAAAVSMKLVDAQTDLQPKHGAPREKLVAHWKNLIEKRIQQNDPIFIAWSRLMAVPEDALKSPDHEVLKSLQEDPQVPEIFKDALRTSPPQSHLDVARLYARLLHEVSEEWKQLQTQTPPAESLPDAQRELLRKILVGTDSNMDLKLEGDSPLFERDQRDRIRELRKQVAEWDATSPDAPPRAMVMLDKDQPVQPAVFVRGDPNRRGDVIDRHAPRILEPAAEKPFTRGSGRLELAEKIVSDDNPLTARVLVNRVWMRHFGTALVGTASDFGSRAEEPTHPELLDHLAWTFIHEDHWSLKSLHRRILLSQAYLQSSSDRPEARKIDPENRLLWRQNRQRMDFEAMRDAMLQVAGQLNDGLTGRPFNIEEHPNTPRRTIYAQIDRNNLPGLFRTFDFPSPDSSSPGRPLTTVPQQALFVMNSPFALTVAEQLAADVRSRSSETTEQARLLIERVYARPAKPEEVKALGQYLESHPLEQLGQAVMMSNEFLFVD